METVGKAVDPELKARIERESEAVFSSARLWVSLRGQKSWVYAKK
jgi:hypothetical protein